MCLIHFCISPLTRHGMITITDPCRPRYTQKVLQNALNATNTSHSSPERRTCGLGDVSAEFRRIYYQLCFLYLFWTAEPFIDASLRFGCRAEKRRRTFFPETWVWHCLNVRYSDSFYICACVKKTLKMCFFVWFCATCLRLNILGVPDCLCLRGMYSELKGFAVGRAISRAVERNKRSVGMSSGIQGTKRCGRSGCTQRVRCQWNVWLLSVFINLNLPIRALPPVVGVNVLCLKWESWNGLSHSQQLLSFILSQNKWTAHRFPYVCFHWMGFQLDQISCQVQSFAFWSIKVEFGQLWSRGRVCVQFVRFIMPCDSFPRPTFNMFCQ